MSLFRFKDTLNTLILLGDVFEVGWLDPITISPQSNQERKANWKQNDVCSLFINAVRHMAEEDDVKVFYIRGNHDHEMDAETVRDLFGPKVEFIPGTLIYVINSDDGKQYRVRFAHGHDWDVFNTYSVSEPGDELCGKPIGYYVARAGATSGKLMDGVLQVGDNFRSYLFLPATCQRYVHLITKNWNIRDGVLICQAAIKYESLYQIEVCFV